MRVPHCSRTRDRRRRPASLVYHALRRCRRGDREKVSQAHYISSTLQYCFTAGLMLELRECVEAIWKSLRQSLGQDTSASTTNSSAKSIYSDSSRLSPGLDLRRQRCKGTASAGISHSGRPYIEIANVASLIGHKLDATLLPGHLFMNNNFFLWAVCR
ncbi:hypothetical protein GE09DRAFT_508291 [Coniochaeta sp. 2T2.1]|nr:hypothetical protein GE09DRAFT_508291 [Coniochaeta sp. 2T2.1]